MSLFRRIFFFLALNIVIFLTISVILHVLGLDQYLIGSIGFGRHPGVSAQSLNYEKLFLASLVIGFAGAFISLGLSRIMAKLFMRVKVIDPNQAHLNPVHKDLLQMVSNLANRAGLPKMPEVGYYESPEVNAFATGPSKRRSLVAVSTGLLDRMDRNEVEGVLAHEVAHIANGDMVTMTLLQGVINTFVYFLARVIAFALAKSSDNENAQPSYLVIFAFEIVFGILGMMVLAAFSRFREYRADQGGAELAGSAKMVAALKKLQVISMQPQLIEVESSPNAQQFSNLKINTKGRGITRWFRTHPPLEDRIAKLSGGSHVS